jgi:hypothetical protein
VYLFFERGFFEDKVKILLNGKKYSLKLTTDRSTDHANSINIGYARDEENLKISINGSVYFSVNLKKDKRNIFIVNHHKDDKTLFFNWSKYVPYYD